MCVAHHAEVLLPPSGPEAKLLGGKEVVAQIALCVPYPPTIHFCRAASPLEARTLLIHKSSR